MSSFAEHSVHSLREAESAQEPPRATERRECKSRVTLLLRDADSGQIDHMAAEHTHGPHHPCTSSSRLGARGTLLAIDNFQLAGGTPTRVYYVVIHFYDKILYILLFFMRVSQSGAGADGALGNQLERKRENSKTLTPIARPGETTKHKSSRAQWMPNTIHTDRATQCGGGSRMRSFSRSASFKSK